LSTDCLSREQFARRIAAVALLCVSSLSLAQDYDLVLSGGRIIDPTNGIDAVANLAIRAGKVAAVTAEPLAGKTTVDVSGLVVSPGFIDLHSHAITPRGQYFQAHDGVTTALELEAGVFPVGAVTQLFKHGASINYGASVSHLAVRQQVMGNVLQAHPLLAASTLDSRQSSNPQAAFRTTATQAQVTQIAEKLSDGLAAGGLGIGLLLDYLSVAVDDRELTMVFDVAAKHSAPVIAHIRRGLPGDESGLSELIRQAERSGAALHVCHLNASAMQAVDRFLMLIAQARARGVDVTTEAYPYSAGSTNIGAAVFGRNWQQIFAIDYADVEWAESGERLSKSRFDELRASEPEGLVIHHYGREDWTRKAIVAPGVMLASDAMPIGDSTTGVHPRGMGTFSRFLHQYVDEKSEASLDLSEAITKMSAAPAKRLKTVAPVFANKGHLAVGADADITVFDPAQMRDQASYQKPLSESVGVRFLLVNGEFVIADGVFINDAKPGKQLKSAR
jgi:N-acyl-D-aspartate/D-glutamate deacylase